MRKYGPLTELGPGIWPESCEQQGVCHRKKKKNELGRPNGITK